MIVSDIGCESHHQAACSVKACSEQHSPRMLHTTVALHVPCTKRTSYVESDFTLLSAVSQEEELVWSSEAQTGQHGICLELKAEVKTVTHASKGRSGVCISPQSGVPQKAQGGPPLAGTDPAACCCWPLGSHRRR